MAWGLEVRVPFLDKAFLEAAMNIKPEEKMFSKGKGQGVDEDGRPRMEKVTAFPSQCAIRFTYFLSTFCGKLLTASGTARYSFSGCLKLKIFDSYSKALPS